MKKRRMRSPIKKNGYAAFGMLVERRVVELAKRVQRQEREIHAAMAAGREPAPLDPWEGIPAFDRQLATPVRCGKCRNEHLALCENGLCGKCDRREWMK